jgi:hypothetical protein
MAATAERETVPASGHASPYVAADQGGPPTTALASATTL